ncbi:MAG TPA: ABC transporter permease [Spirochaetota bacterium]|nr:ABC transporter permease [Spirochaetota bacterium]HOM38102.1 ABC transporter permease [Spirochaetota bacterium]HPQ48904.1 ABC transporter permease [Spirochaetota bacterium]
MSLNEILKEFKKDKISYAALLIILFISFIAIYAPIIANNKPFLIYTDSRIIYLDFVDSATSTLKVILKNMEEKKQEIDKKYVKWAKYCLSEAKKFIKDKSIVSKIDNIDLEKIIKEKAIERLKLIISITEKLDNIEIKKRIFTPLLNSLTFLDYFLMLLPLIFFALKFFNKILKKNFTFKKIVLLSIFTTLIISFVISETTVNFPSYNYKKLIKNSNSFAIFPIIPYGENENIIPEAKQPPTVFIEKKEDQNFHLFGTDTNGRDVLARMIYGSRISMSIGFVAVGISVIIGIIIGAIAGYYGGIVDILISRLMEIVICFPVFFLILSIMAFLRPNIFNVMVVIGLTGWPSIARLVRGEFLKLREFDFVKAAKALGASDLRIMIKHILPNGITPVIVSATFGIAGAVLLEAGLSFLGFGVPQPTASWGDLLNNGRDDIYGAWHLTLFPGIAIFLTVTGFNLIGEKLRDIFDPRKK